MNLSIFAERLSELIFDTEMKPEDLAKAIGCSRSSAYELLSGNREPTLETLIRIADYFKCTTDYLVGLEKENSACSFKQCPPFKDRLTEICAYFKITRYKLMKITNISRTSLNYWARGLTVPTVSNLYKMAKSLECSLDFILGRD